MTITERLKSIPAIASYMLVIIVCVTATYFITQWFTPAPASSGSGARPVTDSTAIKRALAERDEALAAKQNMWEKLLRIHKEGKPISIQQDAPESMPFTEIELPGDTLRDTVYVPKFYDVNFITWGKVEKNKILLQTINPYLQHTNQQFYRLWTFERNGDRFEFAASRSQSDDNIDGIKLIYNDPPVTFEGFRAGVMAGMPFEWYVHANARIEFYRKVGLEVEVRSSKTPVWLGLDIKF